jgi:hypothetical protein
LGKFIDLTGQKFGRLTVLYRIENYIDPKSKTIFVQWMCKCGCGNETKVRTSLLRDERTRSCGCLQIESSKRTIKAIQGIGKLPEGEACFNAVYETYKQNAKARNIVFNLNKNLFYDLTQKPCYYCGKSFSNKKDIKTSNGSFSYNGIDRINSNIGYIESNCVPCCCQCNRSKSDYSIDEFYEWIKKVYNYMKNEQK